jgi:ATP-dependent DNA helicase RecG
MAHLDLSVTTLHGVGDAMAEHLARLGLRSLRDLIWYFPRQYEDRSDITPISEVQADTPVTISAGIQHIRARRAFRRRHMSIVEALLNDDSGSIKAVWFNQPYLSEQLKNQVQFFFPSKLERHQPHQMLLS